MRRAIAGAIGLLALVGCGGRVHVDESTPVTANEEVDVWSHGKEFRMHATLVMLDSIGGIPYNRPLTCDSCWFGIPRSQVDSAVMKKQSELVKGIKAQARGLLLLYTYSVLP